MENLKKGRAHSSSSMRPHSNPSEYPSKLLVKIPSGQNQAESLSGQIYFIKTIAEKEKEAVSQISMDQFG